MTPTPSAAFGLVLAGFLLLYAEALRPRLVIPGVLGLMAILTGLFAWFLRQPSPIGIACLGLAAILFTAEAFLRIRFLAGLLASLFLVTGTVAMFPDQGRISILFALGAGLPFSCLTLWLANAAHRGRRNKRHPDLE